MKALKFIGVVLAVGAIPTRSCFPSSSATSSSRTPQLRVKQLNVPLDASAQLDWGQSSASGDLARQSAPGEAAQAEVGQAVKRASGTGLARSAIMH